jgi:hypothetical protein
MNNPTNKSRRASTLARICAMMARTTDNGCSEAEAAEAARKVDELMALYEIDLDEVSMREQEIIEVQIATADHTVQYAAGAIGAFTDCRYGEGAAQGSRSSASRSTPRSPNTSSSCSSGRSTARERRSFCSIRTKTSSTRGAAPSCCGHSASAWAGDPVQRSGPAAARTTMTCA